MNLYAKTEVFTHPADAPRTPKTARWRGLVCQRPDGTVLARCPHAHRGSMAAHKCAVGLMNDQPHEVKFPPATVAPRAEPGAEEALVKWFRDLFAARSGTNDPLDFDPSYRVTWTEVWEKMKELGYTQSVVDGRIEWATIARRWGLEPATLASDTKQENPGE